MESIIIWVGPQTQSRACAAFPWQIPILGERETGSDLCRKYDAIEKKLLYSFIPIIFMSAYCVPGSILESGHSVNGTRVPFLPECRV